MKKFLTTSLLAFSMLAGMQQVDAQNTALIARKATGPVCIGEGLLGLPGCVKMTQTAYSVAPSGDEVVVWHGMVPVAQRPARTLTHTDIHRERGRTYATKSVISPNGEATLSLRFKDRRTDALLVRKATGDACIGYGLLGLPGCVKMTQTSFSVSPSGDEQAVWHGMVPVAQRPTKTLVHDATYTESGRVYKTHGVVSPNGEATLAFKYRVK